MRDGEFDYPEHPEEYLPAWVFDLKNCQTCDYPIIPDWKEMEWGGERCACEEESS